MATGRMAVDYGALEAALDALGRIRGRLGAGAPDAALEYTGGQAAAELGQALALIAGIEAELAGLAGAAAAAIAAAGGAFGRADAALAAGLSGGPAGAPDG